MSILTLLEMIAEAEPERAAVVHGGRDLSYGELRRLASGVGQIVRESGAAHLARLGLGGSVEPIMLFGAASAGVPYAPLNYRLTAPELNALVDRVLPAVLVADPQFADLITPRQGLTIVTPDALVAQAAKLEAVADPVPAAPEDGALLLFTSGTSGPPKAAVLRHQNLFAYVVGSVEFMGADPAETSLVTVPPYHIAGIAALLSGTYSGRRLAFLESFSPEAWLASCSRHNVTHAFLVPTMLARVVDALPAGATAPAVRAIAYGGGRMPEPVVRRAVTLFPTTDFTNAYGLTETSSSICLLTPDDHRDAANAPGDSEAARRLGSVGRPLPGVELEIRDDHGKPVGPGISGTVFVRGEQVAGEYRETGSVLDKDGWFNTRDRGMLDSEGYLFLEGRSDDIIVRGGENISPGEIESVLTAHPAIQDAAVVPVPDDEWGEVVGAAVVLKSGANATVTELQDWVKGSLRSSRVPVYIRFERELPYNEMGKLLRRVTRQAMADAVVKAPA
jgi:acyl-CoA synthetase (AMP-forming)/AMP-acid ligase II